MTGQHRELYEFGPFRLDAGERLLLRESEVVALTPKAFDLLLTLLEQAGHLLEKEELLQAVWPDQFVEENNLADNISKLRKALGKSANGQKFIETVPKRGYRFVAEVLEVHETSPTAVAVTAPAGASIAPVPATMVLPEAESPLASPRSLPRLGRRSAVVLVLLLGFVTALGWGLSRQRAPRHVPKADAYELYVQGRERWNRRTTEDLLAARDLFEQSVALDGQYAEAHAGVADCYALLNVYGAFPAKDMYPKALAAANYALSLDDTLVQTQATLGFINYRYLWDWDAAEQSFQRALKLDPRYETAQHWYGEFLVARGRFDEGLAHLRVAEQINPFSLIIRTDLGWDLFLARHYDEAAVQLQRTLEMDPNYEMAHYCFVDLYAQQGQWAEAMGALQKCPSLSGGSAQAMAQVQMEYTHAGFPAAIRKWLALTLERRAQQQGYTSPMEMARYYVLLGEKDEAFKWLDVAWNEHNADLAFLKVNPNFDALRSDVRFTALLQHLNLAP